MNEKLARKVDRCLAQIIKAGWDASFEQGPDDSYVIVRAVNPHDVSQHVTMTWYIDVETGRARFHDGELMEVKHHKTFRNSKEAMNYLRVA